MILKVPSEQTIKQLKQRYREEIKEKNPDKFELPLRLFVNGREMKDAHKVGAY